MGRINSHIIDSRSVGLFCNIYLFYQMTAKEKAKKVFNLVNFDFSQITDVLHRKIVYSLLLLALGGMGKLMWGQHNNESKTDVVSQKTDTTKTLLSSHFDSLMLRFNQQDTKFNTLSGLILQHIGMEELVIPKLQEDHLNDSNRIEDVAFALRMLKYQVQEDKTQHHGSN